MLLIMLRDSAEEKEPDDFASHEPVGYPTRSELAFAIQEALEQAAIGVPFPQRDLHLVSVSPNAAADLGSGRRPPRRPSPPSRTDAGD
jgi:potassium efflux system protein